MTKRTETTELRGQPVELQNGMVCANTRNGMAGTGDLRPPVYRDGALDAYALPSRVGGRLHYPDGRVLSATNHEDLRARLHEEYRVGFDAPPEN